MGSRTLGELLLRPNSLSLAHTPLCRALYPYIRGTPPSWTAQRCISSTPNPPAAQPQRKDDDDFDYTPTPDPFAARPPPSRTSPRQTSQNDALQAVDSLFAPTPNQRRTSAPTQFPSSGDEMRAARGKHVFGSEFAGTGPTRFQRGAKPRLNFDDMDMDGPGMLDPNLSNKPSEAASLATQQAEAFAQYPHLNPTYGRAVDLDASRGRDLVRGIGMLGSLMARNKVRHDMMKQRFHERPGLKRKRLNSERWRAKFKRGFEHVTARVAELTRKGW